MTYVQKSQTARQKLAERFFIAVDGHGGSGKSSLANVLAQSIGAEIIHTDDFAGWNNPLNWYAEVISQVFEPIAADASMLSYQPVSWWEDHNPDPVINQPVTDVMILEGVSSSRSEFADYISLAIFVDTQKTTCLERGVRRDMATGKSKNELIKMWEDWFAEEEEYFMRDHPRQRADIILDGTIPFEQQVML